MWRSLECCPFSCRILILDCRILEQVSSRLIQSWLSCSQWLLVNIKGLVPFQAADAGAAGQWSVWKEGRKLLQWRTRLLYNHLPHSAVLAGGQWERGGWAFHKYKPPQSSLEMNSRFRMQQCGRIGQYAICNMIYANKRSWTSICGCF